MESIPLPEDLKMKVVKMACLMELADHFKDERYVLVKRINTIIAGNTLHLSCLERHMYYALGGPGRIKDEYLQFCMLLWGSSRHSVPEQFAKLYALPYTIAEYEYVLGHLAMFYPSIHPSIDDYDGDIYMFPDAKYTEGRWM